MDIMELGAIGELVGGIAVLVTLIYLVIQIRSSNRLAEAGTALAHLKSQINQRHQHRDAADELSEVRELREVHGYASSVGWSAMAN